MTKTYDPMLPYRIGGLLYVPAVHKGIADKIQQGTYPCLTSVALCLEDSINDEHLPEAEKVLKETLCKLSEVGRAGKPLPLLFVRVRTPDHLEHIHRLLGEEEGVLTGYIFPKFDSSNAERYLAVFQGIAAEHEKPLYMMPILESREIASLESRHKALFYLKRLLDEHKDAVLNVRVGGNDFSNLYGLRRSASQSIYEAGIVSDILKDIVNVFAPDYVVSGPVWEYFENSDGTDWRTGLERELELDRLNGFVGKTAIHPSQLPVIFKSLQVRKQDLEDAKNILGWTDGVKGVQKSWDGSRMNEVKCHGRWAEKILTLSQVYGVEDGDNE